MIITRAIFHNYGLHRQRELEFSAGLNCIVGPNGSGKSTILNGLLWGLTGINRAPGKFEENISQYAGSEERAGVEQWFSHNGKQYHLKRFMRPDSCQLVIDGGKPITGSTKVTTRLLEELTTTRDQLQDFVFIQQLKLADWFNRQSAQRAQEMQSLFRLGNVEKSYDAIGKFVGKVRPPATVGDILTLDNKRKQLAQQKQQWEAELAKLTDVPDDTTQYVSERQQLLNLVQQRKDFEDRIIRGEQQEQMLLQQLQTRQTQLQACQADLLVFQQGLEPLALQAETARQLLAQWTAYSNYQSQQVSFEEVRAEVIRELQAIPWRPEQPDCYAEVCSPEFVAVHQSLATACTTLHSTLQTFRLLRAGDPCPTCKAPAQDIANRVAELEQQLAKVTEQLTPYNEKAQLVRNWQQAWQTWGMQNQQARLSKKRLMQHKVAIRVVAKPALSRDECLEILLNHDQLVAVKQTTEVTASGHASAAQQLQLQLQQTQAETLRLRQQLLLLPLVTPEQEMTCRRELETMQQRSQYKTNIRNSIGAIRGELFAAEQLLTASRDAVAQQRKIQFALDRLAKVREILHHSAAPRVYTFTKLEEMLEEINQTLELFYADFRVTVDESLCFWCDFLDGKRRHTDRFLSVGQLGVLSMAMLVAMNATYASHLGLLGLDEPTAGWDFKNVSSVTKAFARMREISTERGLQVLLITHDERLIDTFDTVIQLS